MADGMRGADWSERKWRMLIGWEDWWMTNYGGGDVLGALFG